MECKSKEKRERNRSTVLDQHRQHSHKQDGQLQRQVRRLSPGSHSRRKPEPHPQYQMDEQMNARRALPLRRSSIVDQLAPRPVFPHRMFECELDRLLEP